MVPVRRRAVGHVLRVLSVALVGAGCVGGGAPSPAPSPSAAVQAPPTPPVPTAVIASPTPIPAAPPEAKPAAQPKPTAAEPGRVRVVNTEGQGANLRREPNPAAERVKSVREGVELEILGPDREADGRTWRNVRDPSDGATGWIAAELLETVAAPPAADAQRPEPPAPAAAAASPQPAVAGPAGPPQRVGDEDRAYLAALQPEVDTLGKAITQATQQMEQATGRPQVFDEPGWQSAANGAVSGLTDSARRIRAAEPGPNTTEVHEHAVNAADRAEEAGRLLARAVEAKDPAAFGPTRLALLRVLSEINAMNGVLIDLR